MAKTNAKREKSKDTVEDESNESVVSGGATVNFTNVDKQGFNGLVETFNKQVNGTEASLKNAIDAYDAFITDKTNETKTAAITAINDAATKIVLTQDLVLQDTEQTLTPQAIHTALKTVYDKYFLNYESAKTKYELLTTQAS